MTQHHHIPILVSRKSDHEMYIATCIKLETARLLFKIILTEIEMLFYHCFPQEQECRYCANQTH